MKNMLETNIPMNVNQRLNNMSFLWSSDLTVDSTISLLETMAKYLGQKKTKDKTIAVVLNDFTDHFHFGAYTSFIPQNEENDNEGSWQINYTFNKDDIDDKNMEVHLYTESEVTILFEDMSFARGGITWSYQQDIENKEASEASSQSIMCIIMDTIKEYMQANVSMDNEMSITNFMTFKAEVEGNSVYIECEPSAILKQYIKDDKSIDN